MKLFILWEFTKDFGEDATKEIVGVFDSIELVKLMKPENKYTIQEIELNEIIQLRENND